MTNHWILGCPMVLSLLSRFHVIPYGHISTLVSPSLDLKPHVLAVHGFPKFPNQCHTAPAWQHPCRPCRKLPAAARGFPLQVESNELIRFYGQVTQDFDWDLMISILREEMYYVYKFQSGDCVGRSCFLLCPQSFELTVGRHTWLEAISRSCQPCSSQGRRGMPQTSTVCGGMSSGSGHGRDAPPFVDDVVLSETWVPHQKLPFQGIYLPF